MPSSDAPALVVTGATSGIGHAIAREFLARGWRVFGSARREEDARRLVSELGPGFTPLLLDVTDEASVAEAAAIVGRALGTRRLAGIVANAGIGIPAPLEHQEVDDWRRQIEVNLVGTMITARAFLPLLGTDPAREGAPGRLVTMSSLGGRFGQPFVTAYIASKHGIEGFSEALRREVSPFRIPVIVMAPSAVATPVWEKVAAQNLHRFDATRYGGAFRWALGTIVDSAPTHGLAPEAVARATFAAMTARRPRSRYAPSRRPLLENVLLPLLPKRLVDAVFRSRLSSHMGER
ncbi:SDR family NAD(P)-dependent oxidoreductase [Salinarimonas ramus]|uniref:Short-chain dehydrogenase/reductase n=1 Tax=Salinarimonas ramus TaxID=690164 RepID=A0A917V3A6_9HYPH|nr:SDR family NAD(P)-dependent oxidoreductase [Salinarimonas ramus]GGK28753.1 short-chain dehydrogenase/reductase [Salinarimonas ramus]